MTSPSTEINVENNPKVAVELLREVERVARICAAADNLLHTPADLRTQVGNELVALVMQLQPLAKMEAQATLEVASSFAAVVREAKRSYASISGVVDAYGSEVGTQRAFARSLQGNLDALAVELVQHVRATNRGMWPAE